MMGRVDFMSTLSIIITLCTYFAYCIYGSSTKSGCPLWMYNDTATDPTGECKLCKACSVTQRGPIMYNEKFTNKECHLTIEKLHRVSIDGIWRPLYCTKGDNARCPDINSAYPVSNATWRCDFPQDPRWVFTNCTLVCDEGFELQGNSTVQCNINLTWGKEIPNCLPVPVLSPVRAPDKHLPGLIFPILLTAFALCTSIVVFWKRNRIRNVYQRLRSCKHRYIGKCQECLRPGTNSVRTISREHSGNSLLADGREEEGDPMLVIHNGKHSESTERVNLSPPEQQLSNQESEILSFIQDHSLIQGQPQGQPIGQPQGHPQGHPQGQQNLAMPVIINNRGGVVNFNEPTGQVKIQQNYNVTYTKNESVYRHDKVSERETTARSDSYINDGNMSVAPDPKETAASDQASPKVNECGSGESQVNDCSPGERQVNECGSGKSQVNECSPGQTQSSNIVSHSSAAGSMIAQIQSQPDVETLQSCEDNNYMDDELDWTGLTGSLPGGTAQQEATMEEVVNYNPHRKSPSGESDHSYNLSENETAGIHMTMSGSSSELPMTTDNTRASERLGQNLADGESDTHTSARREDRGAQNVITAGNSATNEQSGDIYIKSVKNVDINCDITIESDEPPSSYLSFIQSPGKLTVEQSEDVKVSKKISIKKPTPGGGNTADKPTPEGSTTDKLAPEGSSTAVKSTPEGSNTAVKPAPVGSSKARNVDSGPACGNGCLSSVSQLIAQPVYYPPKQVTDKDQATYSEPSENSCTCYRCSSSSGSREPHDVSHDELRNESHGKLQNERSYRLQYSSRHSSNQGSAESTKTGWDLESLQSE